MNTTSLSRKWMAWRGLRLSAVLAVIAACAGTTTIIAVAQITPITPGASPADFKPLYVKAEDLADGKRLADSSCSGCHGANGVSTTEGVPNIAGQRSVYLYVEMKAYQGGERRQSIMGNVVKFLNDAALVNVAAYYATLDPAPPSTGAATLKPDSYTAGAEAAKACGGCHGEKGVSKIAGIPSLIGLDPKYFVGALQAYKSGRRKNNVMKAMLANVRDDQFQNIALFYALQNAERAATPSVGDPNAGKAAAAACTGCHGDTGVSSSPANPSIAGQDAQYLVTALLAYKDGTRDDDTMKGMVTGLDDNARKNLAAYFAAQQPEAPNVRKPLTAAEWSQRCDLCHGVKGNSVDPHIPMLAGQRPEYLVKALKEYRGRSRRNSEMAAMSDSLSENDIENLAAYYSHQKARPALYIVVPGAPTSK
jgi:cytochrome c553